MRAKTAALVSFMSAVFEPQNSGDETAEKRALTLPAWLVAPETPTASALPGITTPPAADPPS